MSALISLLLPTRGRPRLAERFLRSAAEHADDRAHVEAVVYADDDDPASHNLDCAGLECRTLVGPRVSMGLCNTACLRGSSGDIVVLTNDDVVIQTRGWDRRLRELHAARPDGVYLAYPNDLFKGRRLCTFPVLSRRTCDLIGDPFPGEYRGAFIDYHLLDIFKRVERLGARRIAYLRDVVFEHMHYRRGKADYDETYRTRPRFGDDATFLAMRDARQRGALRLIRAIAGEESAMGAEVRSQPLPDAPHPAGSLNLLRRLLADSALPLRWRCYLWSWFTLRSLARLGIIPGISKEAQE